MAREVKGSVTVATGWPLFKLWPRGAALAGTAWLVAAVTASAQAPDEDWRTLTTEHFRVTFPAHLESLGRRAAGHAEAAYDVLSLALALPEPGGSRIDLLVTDHSDLSNGWALVKPSKRMTVYAVPPTDGFQLSYYDDWLELVITHELAHVMHLDYAGNPLGRAGRSVFGRAPLDWPLFPGHATPDWVIEGLATWYESRWTGAGRVRGTFHEMQIRTAVLEGRFEQIGAASGRSPLWPAGNRSYLYGSMLFDYLLRRYGEDALSAFVESVAGQWVPYRIDAAARASFGISFSDAWKEWEAELTRRYADLDEDLASLAPVTEAERLTRGARWALHPQVSPDGSVLAHTAADGRSDTQLRMSAAAGGAGRSLARTNGLATFDWMPDGRVLLSQLENADPYTAYGDLYAMDASGAQERLTRGARLSHPSVTPDGRRAVAVQQTSGTNALVRVDLSSGEVSVLVEPVRGAHWAFPQLSPDGRTIAVTRWEAGAYHDVVILDAASGSELQRVTSDRAIDLAPSWSPDGRWLVWSSDRTGISNVLVAGVDPTTGRVGPPRLLTNVRTGVAYPSVDPSGRWLYFSGYHVDGWEVERIPFAPGGAPPAPPPAPRFAATDATRPEPGEAEGAVDEFSSLPTLVPRYWEPRYRDPVVAPEVTVAGSMLRRRELLAFGLGAETGSVDLVGRHEYSAYLQVFTSGGKAEGGLAYTFRGLGNPILSLAASQGYRSAGRIVTPLDTGYVLDRERRLDASVTLLSRRWRRDLSLTLGGAMSWTGREQLDNALRPVPLDAAVPAAPRFGEMSLGISYNTARSHAFQTGGARGVSVALIGRRRLQLGLAPGERGDPAADRSFDELFGRLRGYVPLWVTGHARHVLAVQLAAGAVYGPGSTFGRFGVGGASGSPEEVTGFELFGGSPTLFPVRGYETSSRFGRWAWAGTAEYRFPVALVNGGLGAWPFHLDRVIGSVFADVGNAWEPNPRDAPLTSVGGELSAQLLGFYDAPLLLRSGVAVPLVGGFDVAVYVRVGLSF